MALRKDQGDKPVILFMKLDPLHINILGPPNDVLELLEELYPVEMKKEFYLRHNLKRVGKVQEENLMGLP